MEKVKFSDRHISVGGVLSIVMGSIAVVLVLIGVVLSFLHQGEGPLVVGALGIGALLFDCGGLVIGLLSFKESDKYYKTSIVGSMMCGIFLVMLLGIILV
ncbi:MAG: DUF6142 family protein [Lachnospiraceae bacterium]